MSDVDISQDVPAKATPDDKTLQPEQYHHRRRSHRRKLLRRIQKRLSIRLKLINVLIVLISVTVVVVVGASAVISDTSNRVETSLDSLSRVLNSIRNRPGTELTLTDFNRLEASLNDVVDALTTAQRQAVLAQPFKSANRDLEATIITLNAAQNLSLAARNMLTGLQPTLFFLVAGSDEQAIVTQISSGERMVELLRLGRGRFAAANDYLVASRSQFEDLDLNGLSPNLILAVEGIRNYQQQLEQINHFLLNSPDLLTVALGLGEEINYLVLAQNNDELRPSGGYISTYGWLTFRNGRVTDYSYSPTTATSPNPPPAVLAGEVQVPSWWIRYNQPIYAAWDGSWYADFPSTARMAMWYYDNGNNPKSPVNGVISMDIVGFEYILGALGSVKLPAYSRVVTPENFRDVVYDIRAFGEGEIPHKRFVAALYQQIFSDWHAASNDPEVSTRLVGALLRSLQEKHVMLYFKDERLNEAVNLLGWSGIQNRATDHDYLLVADTNLGNKSNHSIMRQITYDAVLQPDRSVNGRVTITYDYSARVADTDPAVDGEHHGPLDYNNLLQVFVPEGSTLAEFNGFTAEPQAVESDGHSIFVSRLRVPYDTTERFQYFYRTPAVVENLGAYQRYRLLVQKQPGTLAHMANVQVSLPPGALLISALPEPAANYVLDQPILEFQLTLSSDQWVEIIYSN